MNILLTGGAGYIGSHTSLLLIDKGHEVTIVDNLISGNSKLVPKKANFINSDISDEKKIRDLLKKETLSSTGFYSLTIGYLFSF